MNMGLFQLGTMKKIIYFQTAVGKSKENWIDLARDKKIEEAL